MVNHISETWSYCNYMLWKSVKKLCTRYNWTWSACLHSWYVTILEIMTARQKVLCQVKRIISGYVCRQPKHFVLWLFTIQCPTSDSWLSVSLCVVPGSWADRSPLHEAASQGRLLALRTLLAQVITTHRECTVDNIAREQGVILEMWGPKGVCV